MSGPLRSASDARRTARRLREQLQGHVEDVDHVLDGNVRRMVAMATDLENWLETHT